MLTAVRPLWDDHVRETPLSAPSDRGEVQGFRELSNCKATRTGSQACWESPAPGPVHRCFSVRRALLPWRRQAAFRLGTQDMQEKVSAEKGGSDALILGGNF